jgi:hypothetical protein
MCLAFRQSLAEGCTGENAGAKSVPEKAEIACEGSFHVKQGPGAGSCDDCFVPRETIQPAFKANEGGSRCFT